MSVKELKNWTIKKIKKYPGLTVEYFEIADNETLLPVVKWDQKEKVIACAAIKLRDVRLIDNIELFS